jgi:biotin carboxylase
MSTPADPAIGRAAHVLLVGGRAHNVERLVRAGVEYSLVQLPALADDQHARGARHHALLDYRSQAELLAVARAWHAQDPFDAVVSFTEYGLEPASRCAAALGVAGDNTRAVLATRDKTRTRELLDRAGLSPVRYRVCAQPAEAEAFLAALPGTAAVMKPVAGGLSEGVYRVTSAADIRAYWGWTTRYAAGRPVLVEEYLDGPEYSVETMSRQGRHEVVLVTEKLTTGFPGFVELGHQVPARLDGRRHRSVAELITTFLDLVGQHTGPVHTELRLTPNGPRIIEAQTRIAGDQIWEMAELVTGADLIAETVAGLLGRPSPARHPSTRAAAIRFFGYSDLMVRQVRGLEAARRAPGVVRVVCALAPGRRLGPLVSSDSRQGYVLCTGASTAEAVTRAQAAHDLVEVDADEPVPAGPGPGVRPGAP